MLKSLAPCSEGLWKLSVCLIWLLICPQALAQQTDPFPSVAASYLVEVNGTLLWGRHVRQQLPPASLTKLMTAILVAEQSRPESMVVVSREASRESGTRLGLEQGAKFRVKDLLAAMLIESANDACRALADHVGGSQLKFVEMMNHRARLLGLRDTHFSNACGHDASGHYSSAGDMAIVADSFLKINQLARFSSMREMQITTLDGARRYRLKNSNALIGRYSGALGLKTGYTSKAGKCLIAYARRNDVSILLVFFNASNRWWDAASILDLAFEHARHAS